ncbi:MAG: hypothetical protein GF418_14720 [Chitinivibrionales bacterium]|nr:hypothetical protein [Chitinivibrionales bacterium]MBD3396873.1 hypothetical protein [Chitinivibrionales bacterium]
MTKSSLKLIFADILLLTTTLVVFLALRGGGLATQWPRYDIAYAVFLAVWIVVSFAFGKYALFARRRIDEMLVPVVAANGGALAASAFLMYATSDTNYSRTVVFGAILITTFVELVYASHHYFTHAESRGPSHAAPRDTLSAPDALPAFSGATRARAGILLETASLKAVGFALNALKDSLENAAVVHSNSLFTAQSILPYGAPGMVNLQRLNEVRGINRYFQVVNERLRPGGVLVGCVETLEQRMYRLVRTFTPLLVALGYAFDFTFHRVLPKLAPTRSHYFNLTRGYSRVLSRAEVLGRLYCCGFEVIAEENIDGLFWFAARKVKQPMRDAPPTYGPLIALSRIGRDNKRLAVYKMRTMHPYSEYLQEYIYKHYNLKEGGKFQNDFRVTTLGRLMRKTFIDELPMFINFFLGQMKLVGVRPLSAHYFNLYSKELQEKRTRVKPGLIPPFYADNPKTLEEIQASEMKYLTAYLKHPWLTDVRYFFLAVFNIVFRRFRSS